MTCGLYIQWFTFLIPLKKLSSLCTADLEGGVGGLLLQKVKNAEMDPITVGIRNIHDNVNMSSGLETTRGETKNATAIPKGFAKGKRIQLFNWLHYHKFQCL